MKNLLTKPYVIFLIIGFGILVAVALVKTRTTIEHAGGEMPSKNVSVINVRKVPFRAQVTAYGNVEPAITLRNLAQLSGTISYLHPELKQGNSISAGTVVVRIDPEDYEVILKQTEADLSASRASLKQLEVEQKTTTRSLVLSTKNLRVQQKELQRIEDVFKRKLVARATLDAEQQKVLQIEQQVSDLQGKLDAYPSRKALVRAQIKRAEEQVKGQKTTLGRTEIILPFNARIGEVLIEKNQFVNIGFTLFEALDVNGIEINAQLPIVHMRALTSHLQDESLNSQQKSSMKSVLQRLKLQSKVRLVGDMPDAVWDANVLRMSESVDPSRRTLGIVVGVEKPYEKIIPGKRPPLLKGMFMAVEIFAPSQQAIVIPRKAIHDGRVYLVGNENKLKISSVKVLHHQGELAVIASGLKPGDIIIINDLVPVIDGMLLSPIVDEDYEKQLLNLAIGAK